MGPAEAALLGAHTRQDWSPVSSRVIPYHQGGDKYCCASPASRRSPVLSRSDEMDLGLVLKTGKLRGRDNVPYEFLLHMNTSLKSTALSLQHRVGSGGVFYRTGNPPPATYTKNRKDPTLPVKDTALSLSSPAWVAPGATGGPLAYPGGLEDESPERGAVWLQARRSTLDVHAQAGVSTPVDTYCGREVMTSLCVDLEGHWTASHEGHPP
ncbi:hypothetical protein GWK47_027569 [Chionoecetes opilio]|uniref:Uncharacterized protein n=1 Tax=Chionoecetes opilio TaxID=41210 RepID=A0A8J8W993_CHIOP|nr:hypothetical protein GWK47_027569 [Chionoecetes opilio]